MWQFLELGFALRTLNSALKLPSCTPKLFKKATVRPPPFACTYLSLLSILMGIGKIVQLCNSENTDFDVCHLSGWEEYL